MSEQPSAENDALVTCPECRSTFEAEDGTVHDPDFPELVRYHGASEVLDAVLAVAVEAYGPERAEAKVRELVSARAARVTPPGKGQGA